jgi:acetyltransferase-like isoleucine patch superfamily enzyme
MKKIINLLVPALMAFLPSRLKIIVLNNFFNAEIHPTARIGMSFIQVGKLKMGPNASIGHLNVIRGLELLEMKDHAVILKQNTITAIPLENSHQFKQEPNRYPALVMGEHSAIVSKHFLDCNNTIVIGNHTTIAGLGSAFFTHAINIETNRQESAPIHIGSYCMIGAMCCVLKGTQVPDCSVIAANSTVRGVLQSTHALYSGVPAQFIKPLNPEAGYFTREVGYVD